MGDEPSTDSSQPLPNRHVSNHARDIHASGYARVQVGDQHHYAQSDLPTRKTKVLKDLTSLSYEERKNLNPERVPGTCEWFIGHHLYQEWRDAQSSALLGVSADPGCGKSVLARHIVDKLESLGQTVCYFFFKDGIKEQQSAKMALRCILRQLLDKRPELFTLRILVQFESAGYLLDSLDALWSLTEKILEDPKAGEITYVLDALDECREDERSRLVQALRRFYNRGSSGTSRLKVLLTSRPYQNMREAFADMHVIHLAGESDEERRKITKEIDLFVRARIAKIARDKRLSKAHESLLVNALAKVKHRTYLYVHLVLDLINKETFRGTKAAQILSIVATLPQSVNDAYEEILRKAADAGEARRLLQIVVAAKQPLTVEEMEVALAIQSDHKLAAHLELDEDGQASFEEYIRELCGLFIIIVDSKVHLLHQTAREFLLDDDPSLPALSLKPEWRHSINLQSSHRLLAEVCIRYLLFEDIQQDPPKDIDLLMFRKRRGIFLFFPYASCSWHYHSRQGDYQDVDQMMRLCQSYPTAQRNSPHQRSNKNLSLPIVLSSADSHDLRLSSDDNPYQFMGGPPWFRLYWAETTSDRYLVLNHHPLGIASYCGLAIVVRKILEEGDLSQVTARCLPDGQSPVAWAAALGHHDVLKVILDFFPPRMRRLLKCNPVEITSEFGQTPLALAALHGHPETVELLLNEGAEICSKDRDGGTPEEYAMLSGDSRVTQVISNHLAKIGEVSNNRCNIWRMLIAAIARDDHKIVIQALRSGQASAHTRISTTDLVDSKSRRYSPKIIGIFKKYAAKITNDQDSSPQGSQPLEHKGPLGRVEDLEYDRMSPGKQDLEKDSAVYSISMIELAAFAGSYKVVDTLLEWDEELQHISSVGNLTLLHWAALGSDYGSDNWCRTGIAKIWLVDLRRDPNCHTTNGETAIQLSKNETLQTFLLGGGAKASVDDLLPILWSNPFKLVDFVASGRAAVSPESKLLEGDNQAMARTLSTAWIPYSIKNNYGSGLRRKISFDTAVIITASGSGNAPVLQKFLEAGIERAWWDWLVTLAVAYEPGTRCMELLLAFGASPDGGSKAPDHELCQLFCEVSLTPVLAARRGGHLAAENVLRRHGAKG